MRELISLFISAMLGAAAAFWVASAVVGAERDKVVAEFAQYRANTLDSVRQQVEAAREDERRTQIQLSKELENAHQSLTAARAAADDARSALDRLRARARAVAAGGQCPAQHPAAAASGPAAGDPAGLLADLLVEAAAEARRYAEIADNARIAGQLCERSYDALTEH